MLYLLKQVPWTTTELATPSMSALSILDPWLRVLASVCLSPGLAYGPSVEIPTGSASKFT